jgi:hypothetical protein
MDSLTYNGQDLKAMIYAGKLWLEAHYQRVNQLNVFPVPDGDTGTNMMLTIRNAYKEIAESDSPHTGQVAKKVAYGAIMGSRGNSGTIMSQILAGLAQTLEDQAEFDPPLLIKALKLAADKAYAGVQKPVEGTILTVIRELAEEGQQWQDSNLDLTGLLEKLVARGWVSVEHTPELLPRLKEAGVVDSGGAGLMYIFEGMLRHRRGESLQLPGQSLEDIEASFAAALAHEDEAEADLLALEAEAYNYDVQFVLKGQNLPINQIRADIEAMGDSGVIIGNEGLIKVHIHVDDPGIPISYAVKFGDLEDVVVENMHLQYLALLEKQQARQEHRQVTFRPLSAGQVGVVAVAAGNGLARVLADLGVNAIVEGGQTNNPSTEEILAALRSLPTDKVLILPNNKNIFLAAKQAAEHSPDVQVRVIPTQTFAQGVAAMVVYQAEADLDKLTAQMNQAAREVLSIEITQAIRSVEIEGVAVQAGQMIGMIDTQLKAAAPDSLSLLQGLFAELDIDDYGLLTLYYGEGVKLPEAQALQAALQSEFEGLEVEVVYGGQAHYPYLISLE